jgi:hypothetical protein
VGTDYEGYLVMPFEDGLARALEQGVPWRFDTNHADPEFASLWTVGLLEGAIARATKANEPYCSGSPAVVSAIDELVAGVQSERSVRVAAVVSDLDVSALPMAHRAVRECRVFGARVLEVGNQSERYLELEIPGAGYLVDRSDAFAFPGPTALVVVDEEGWASRQSSASWALWRLSTLLTAIRLVTGSTAHMLVVAEGSPSHVSPLGRQLRRQPHAGMMRIGYRHARLTPEFLVAVDRLLRGDLGLLLRADAASSDLLVALGRFNRVMGNHEEPLLDRLMDVSIGLEAALGGPDRADLALRLRTRAALLLGVDEDSPDALYDDVKVLYDLRSKVVHGDPAAIDRLLKILPRVRTRRTSRLQGEQLQLVLDRYCDVLRRAIAARIALGMGKQPLWPVQETPPDVDRSLVAFGGPEKWRRVVHRYWERRHLAQVVLPSPVLAGLIGSPSLIPSDGGAPARG